jgi:hypothetical protein
MSKLDTHAVEFTLYRHVKTGGLYYIIGLGLLEKDSTPVVLYRGYMKGGLVGNIWVRPRAEFEDGRFKRLHYGTPEECEERLTASNPDAWWNKIGE